VEVDDLGNHRNYDGDQALPRELPAQFYRPFVSGLQNVEHEVLFLPCPGKGMADSTALTALSNRGNNLTVSSSVFMDFLCG
jgi:hypothetical protein